MKVEKTPIAFFTYNRPLHARLSLAALLRCDRIDECCIYAFSDGPKREGDIVLVNATREALRELLPESAVLVERNTNIGLAKSVKDGVSILCTKYGRAIVVEDDLIVTNNFIAYMLDSLDLYAENERVYQISGYMHKVQLCCDTDAVFLPYTTTWGWATWQRAWITMDEDHAGALCCLRNRKLRSKFDLDNSCTYTKMMQEKSEGINDSWGILWWWTVFKQSGLVLHPKVSKLYSIGFDGSGRHSGKSDYPQQLTVDEATTHHFKSDFSFPDQIEIDKLSYKIVVKYFRKLNSVNQMSIKDSIFSWLTKYIKR